MAKKLLETSLGRFSELVFNIGNKSISVDINENDLINYNMNRFVASSKGTSLGGGFGGSGLLNELQDKPGAFIVKQITLPTNPFVSDCTITIEGVTNDMFITHISSGVRFYAEWTP